MVFIINLKILALAFPLIINGESLVKYDFALASVLLARFIGC